MTDLLRRSPPTANRGDPRSPSPSPTGPSWGIRPRLVVDVVLALSFVALMSAPLTGLRPHEWWGIVLIGVVDVHLLAQRNWMAASTTRFLHALTGRLRFTSAKGVLAYLS